jgi:hypothetical protein
MRTIGRETCTLMCVAALSGALYSAAFAQDKSSTDDFGAGIDVRQDASLSQIGLPAYPGATRRRDKHDDSPAVSFGLWGGAFGVRLAVIKFRSSDGIDTITDFYRAAMARYGTVLDCSHAQRHAPSAPKEHGLTCDSSDYEPGQRVYKVGTKSDQIIVALKSVGDEVQFDMVRLSLKGE